MLNRIAACAFAVALAFASLAACGDGIPKPAPPVNLDFPGFPEQDATTPEELVFLSSAVARVRLISASGGVRRYPPQDGYDGRVVPVFVFRFRVIEYLKGSGGDELTVRVLAEDVDPMRYVALAVSAANSRVAPTPTPNPSIALMLAQAALNERDDRWDDREAIVFLRPSPIVRESGVYEFANREGRTPGLYNYAITSDYENSYFPNRAWLPAAAPVSSSSSEPRYLTAAPDSPSAPSISLTEIKALAAANADMMAKGKDIPGYEDCVRTRFEYDALYENRPPDMTFHEIRIPSGKPAGHMLGSSPYPRGPSPYYERHWFAGADADLFASRIADDPDNDPTTGYSVEDSTLRPLPKGEYNVFSNVQYSDWVPCGYNPESLMNRHELTIIAIAPDGVVHEAFFDPADLGSGAAGADGGDGVLRPISFTVNGASASFESIRWDSESRAAEIRMSPHARLANHRADFIALDGSVVLRLDFNDAVETGQGGARAFRWNVRAKPWSGGDKLMLRIGESPSGAARDAETAR